MWPCVRLAQCRKWVRQWWGEGRANLFLISHYSLTASNLGPNPVLVLEKSKKIPRLRRALRNRGPPGRPPRFLIWPKKSGPKSPADFLKAISKAKLLTVRHRQWQCTEPSHVRALDEWCHEAGCCYRRLLEHWEDSGIPPIFASSACSTSRPSSSSGLAEEGSACSLVP